MHKDSFDLVRSFKSERIFVIFQKLKKIVDHIETIPFLTALIVDEDVQINDGIGTFIERDEVIDFWINWKRDVLYMFFFVVISQLFCQVEFNQIMIIFLIIQKSHVILNFKKYVSVEFVLFLFLLVKRWLWYAFPIVISSDHILDPFDSLRNLLLIPILFFLNIVHFVFDY